MRWWGAIFSSSGGAADCRPPWLWICWSHSALPGPTPGVSADLPFSRTVWRLYAGAKGPVVWYYPNVRRERRASVPPVLVGSRKVEFTGLTQHSQVDPAGLAESPYKSLSVDPDSGSTLWISGQGHRIAACFASLSWAAACGYTRARCHSSPTIVVPIGVLHINENGGGRMTKRPSSEAGLLLGEHVREPVARVVAGLAVRRADRGRRRRAVVEVRLPSEQK
jgi:hypothetical protein